MSDAKHTPGPWTATQIISPSCGFIVSDSRGSVVARVHKIGVPKNGNFELPCEENARLIAAAPDLLEALQGILGYFDSGNSVSVSQATIKARSDEVKAARAAIAKATGGAAC